MSDWNAKWDWGSPGMLNSNAIEIPKGGDSRRGESEMGSFYPFGGGVNNGSCSDLGSGLFIMSSTSAFLDSPMKGNNTKILHFDGNSDCFGKKQEEDARLDVCATSPSVCASIVSGETMLGLKLGKRTYFEDVCAGNNVRTSPFSVTSEPSDRVGKKKISSSNAPEVPRCQVQGCSVDLSSAKEYHRKHRVCETHTKCPKVIVGGQERRFCQQCSRFHSLFEFDERKRSCRKRLSDHNARRRKPQSETMQFDTARLVPSLYERRQHTDLIWNGFSRPSIRGSEVDITWENGLGNELIQTKELLNPLDDQQQHIDVSQHPSSMLSENDTNKFFSSSKGATLLAFSQGFGGYTSSSGLVVAQDRALSLLSPNMWGPQCERSHTASLERPSDQGGTQVPWGPPCCMECPRIGTPLKEHYHHHHHHYHDQGMLDSDNGGNEGHLPFHLFRPGIVSSCNHTANDD